MKKNVTELVFILDRSGSMHGLEADTTGGFNSMLDKQRSQEGDANITTVLFDDNYEKIHDRVSIKKVAALTENEYFVRGCTALLDAVGQTIHDMALLQKHLPPEQKAGKVIFVIITDGLENASHIYSKEQVKRMIEREKEGYGWEFLFLGANIDAVSEAGSLGIDADRSVTFQNDSKGIETNFNVVAKTLSAMRSAPCTASIGADWKKEIEEDYNRRKRKSLFRNKRNA